MKKVKIVPIVDPLAEVKAKFAKLAAVREKIQAARELYKEHDQLVSELMPLFVKVEADKFTIARSITLGTEKHNLVPYFYNDQKGQFKSKQWKSTAFETMSIE
jgi:hypothetical protein